MATLQERMEQRRGVSLESRLGTQNLNEELNPWMKLLRETGSLATDVGVGFARGVGSTLKGLGTVGYKMGTSAGLPSLSGQEIYQTGSEQELAAKQALQPQGVAQNVGYFGEKVAESFIPGGVLSKVSKALGAIPNALGRIVARTGAEAAGQGALGYVQSGGDLDAAKTQSLVGGTLKAGTTVLGELAQKANLPLRLYQGILKDPELAKQAKNRGIVGTLAGMVDDVKNQLPDLENKVITVADTTNTRVPINPRLKDIFLALSKDLSNLADDSLSKKAAELAKAAEATDVDMRTALEMRRFIDREIAYTKSGLAPKGDRVLKSFADELREKINATDLGRVMKDYQFYIKMSDALRKEAIRSGNREVVGLLDTILFGAGIAGAEPISGLIAAGTQKAARSPLGRTYLAQVLDKLSETSKTGTAVKSLIGQVLSQNE